MADLSYGEVAAKIASKLDFECKHVIKRETATEDLYFVATYSHKGRESYVAVSLSEEMLDALSTQAEVAESLADFIAKMASERREDFLRDNP